MARKGSLGSKLPPFGGGAFSDLSVYQIGAAAPPPVPTVAPEAGVLPQPVLPKPTVPVIYLAPDEPDRPRVRGTPVIDRAAMAARDLAAHPEWKTGPTNRDYPIPGYAPGAAVIWATGPSPTPATNEARLLAELLAGG